MTTIASGGKRAFATVLDQMFASASNFAVGIAAARDTGASGLGGFSLAYAAWQVLAAVHRSLVTDPMAIDGDVRRARKSGIEEGFAAEIVLGLAGTYLFCVAGCAFMYFRQRAFGEAVLAFAPCLPVLLVQDYWRWIGFMSRKPERALANDFVYNCVQVAALAAVFLTHTHSLVAIIGAWGLGGAAGALYGLHQYQVRPTMSGGLRLMRERWSFSKWLAGTSLSSSAALQANVFVVGAMLGPVGLGGLKAAQTLVAGPSGVLIMAGGSIGLPESSKALAERGWNGLARVARIVAVAGFLSLCCGAIVVALFGRTLLSAIYGHGFGRYETAALLLAVAYVVAALTLGPSLVLKATRNTRLLFNVQLVSIAASLSSTVALTAVYGVNGAAAASVVTFAANGIACRFAQHRARVSTLDEELLPVEVGIESEIAAAAGS